MTDKIGQLLVMGLKGPELSASEADFIVANNIGGVILFERNVGAPDQLHALCRELHSLRHKTRDKIPLFIGIDMEGGRVARLKAPFTEWPPMAQLGKLDSTSLAFKFAMSMGLELKSFGINLNFAPCIDVLTNPNNKVIGDRALGTDAEEVAKMASALVRGFIKAEILPCAKHFPGHGNTSVDSHEDLPVDEDTDLNRLMEVEAQPFKKAFRARIDMAMTGHLKFPKIDPEWPVTLSSIFLKDILRQELRYRGLIISDDLDMKALSKNWSVEEIPVRALQAGCEMLLYCNEPRHPEIAFEAVRKALKDGQLKAQQIDEAYRKVVDVKRAKLAQPDPLPLAEAAKIVGHEDHKALSQAIAEGRVPDNLSPG